MYVHSAMYMTIQGVYALKTERNLGCEQRTAIDVVLRKASSTILPKKRKGKRNEEQWGKEQQQKNKR